MKKLFALSVLLTLSLFARETLYPVKVCPAFNNMKHSKNTHAVYLDTSKKYTIIKEHKGQKLILIKGEQPAQRWVDENCFLAKKKPQNSLDQYIDRLDKKPEKTTNTKKYDNKNISQNNLLALSWHNAFCETHRYKKECKRDVGSLFRSKHHERNFILHGFWPQPQSKAYCAVERKYITMDKYKHWNKLPALGLSTETKNNLTKVMPGVHSSLHKHEWFKHGTCYGTNAEQYFETTISLVEQIHSSPVSNFFEKNIGKKMTLRQIRQQFDKYFGKGAGKSVELQCRQGLITELWLHLSGSGNDLGRLLQKGKQVRSRCTQGILDKVGYGR